MPRETLPVSTTSWTVAGSASAIACAIERRASLRSDVVGEATIKGVTQLIGDKARPVPIDQTLLENLDQAKRLAFLSKWQQAKKGQ